MSFSNTDAPSKEFIRLTGIQPFLPTRRFIQLHILILMRSGTENKILGFSRIVCPRRSRTSGKPMKCLYTITVSCENSLTYLFSYDHLVPLQLDKIMLHIADFYSYCRANFKVDYSFLIFKVHCPFALGRTWLVLGSINY